MGIPKLNRLLLTRCSQKAIYKIHFENLSDKKVVVDISIYLYRFLGDDYFMEHVYLFLSLFKFYRVHPIFVFDGKPPVEKSAIIKKRNMEKQAARIEYSKLESEIVTAENTKALEERMAVLKKKMMRITWEKIDETIELIKAFGFAHYLAPNEADQLCIYLAKSPDIYAVISDDMDMIISGCSRVLRNLNMNTHEIMVYNNEQIQKDLGISIDHLRQIIILSGTDYDLQDRNTVSLNRAFEIYTEYSMQNSDETFYDWLFTNKYITEDFKRIEAILNISPNSAEALETFIQNTPPPPKKISVSIIKNIMRKHRFIFL